MSARRSIADLSAALADRAESFCRQYFPEGRKQGNYWQVGDTSGAKGQSLAIRLQAQGNAEGGPVLSRRGPLPCRTSRHPKG